MINPVLIDLLRSNDTLDVLRLAVSYQVQKMQNIDKIEKGQDWRQRFPEIIEIKFDDYLKDFTNLFSVLQEEENVMFDKMNKDTIPGDCFVLHVILIKMI